MVNQMYQDEKRNDVIHTSVTGHSRPDERQPFNVNAPPYVPNGNYRKNNCDRNNNPENIPKCYYCGRPGHYARKCYNNPNRENISNSKKENISNSKEENISNSKKENISNSKKENISNSKEENISNSNSKEETSSNSNSKEETSSNSNSKEETSSNSNSKEETSSNSNSKEETSSNSNISSVTLEDTNLVCSNPILGSEQSVASNVIARQVLRSDGVYVEGHIQGSEVNFTVDTGAVRTVLSVYAFNKIPHVNRPILEKSNNTLACADGKPLKELGKAIFEIKLGNLCFDTEMIVANIEDEALLGLDVLMKSQWGPADIKLTEGIILLGGHAVHCTQIGQTNKFIRKIYGEAYYEIPPRSENFVDVFIDRLDDDSPETVQDCILQPTEKFSERFPLVMAPCLVNSNSSQANISQDVTCNTSTCSIMNPYMYDQDTVIGSAEVVEHEPKMLLKCEDTLDVNNQIAMRRLQFHDSNLESGKGVSQRRNR
ncbi:Hypothetical predicted protein [Mytilus galloprovincialis]|uniref:CCHC-type domain-containing protein n=1 Tax=Mytilus galloprovincialis TaxID=29158 RepID=A0A8B6DDW2_MYTGA|nr:Hypothetical predicted protein [Mytilus galloprovincialis]